MKQYVLDELRPHDYKKIKGYLDKKLGSGPVDGIYWIPIKEDDLTTVQQEHSDCKPFYAALDLEPTRMACELLIRSHNNLKCRCMGYADLKQRNMLIRYVDAVLDDLNIKI